MKKIVLGIVFVFATVTFVNAENQINEKTNGCGELAQAVYVEALGNGSSYEDAYESSEVMYQSCKWLTYLSGRL